MANPFGPQGPQSATSLPGGSSVTRYLGDTWVQDCSAPGLNDGTQLDAAFFNNIIGNLTYLVRSSGFSPINRGDFTVLYGAVENMIATSLGALSSRVTSAVTQVASLTAQVATILSQVSANTSAIASQNTRITTLETVATVTKPIPSYTYAGLPSAPSTATLAFVTDGRKIGEAPSAGTGVLAYYANSAWRVFSTDEAVTN